jgi:hypothetical protein
VIIFGSVRFLGQKPVQIGFGSVFSVWLGFFNLAWFFFLVWVRFGSVRFFRFQAYKTETEPNQSVFFTVRFF